jgi:DNA/RNA-binding domain of Phe-tRNA-synthetase-like protein
MAEVPMSLEDLEDIVGKISLQLAEKWAIESDISDQDPKEVVADAVDVTAFVINLFFDYYNTMVTMRSLNA